MRIAARSEHPQWDQNTNEAAKMQTEDQTFDERQIPGQKCIEEGHEEHNGDGQQGSVPPFVDIVIVIHWNFRQFLTTIRESFDALQTIRPWPPAAARNDPMATPDCHPKVRSQPTMNDQIFC
jgi:hypothetical protein